jgi:UDP-glucose 4-epimerase
VTGTDWPTPDGSGIRDYVHVWDLARAHLHALRRFDRILPDRLGRKYIAINLGTGHGTTVLELLGAFTTVLGRPIDARFAPRRPGDSAGTYTRSDRARDLLDWEPSLTLADGIRHSLEWAALRELRFRGDSTAESPVRLVSSGQAP